MRLCYHCMTQIHKSKQNTCPHCGKSLKYEPVESRYLKPGIVLQNKFIVGYPMGAGGFGNIYIGWDKFLLRKVVIKEYYPRQYVMRDGRSPIVKLNYPELHRKFRRGLQQFLEEARSMAYLKDIKGVVVASNFFEENGTGYIVMECLEGETVNSLIKRSGNRLSYERSREIILTVLYTLRELHARGVLHRDIAPDNVFITNRGIIKLIDFGAAKHANELANINSGVVLKAGYAPIEQYSRNAVQGPWTDLYAVAALFYRMLTGQKPLPASERLSYETLITPSQMGVSIPEQAEMAIMVCLNVQPMYRLQSADEFMEALDGKEFVPEFDSDQDFQLAPVKEKNNNFPLWGKILVACLLCVVITASVIFAVRGPSTDDLDAGDIAWKDFSGDTIEDVQNYLDKNYHTVTIETEIVYDADESKDGTIEECSVTIDDINRAKNADSQEISDIKVDANGHITATMVCKVYSSKEIRYGELSTLNAYSLAKKMGVATDADIFGKENEKDGTYFEFEEIKLKEGNPISNSDIKDEGNKDKVIAIADIDKIIYYAGDFFYWYSLPTFEGCYIKDTANSDLFNPNTYEKENENSLPKKTNKTKCLYEDESLCDSECFSMGYDEGYVFEQTIPAGEEFDVTADMDKLDENGKLLYIVGKSFIGQINAGISGADLQKEIEEYLGKTNVCEIDGDATQPVKKGSGNVALYLVDQNGNRTPVNNDCARKSDNLVIVIHTEERVVTTQRSTRPKPKPTTESQGH